MRSRDSGVPLGIVQAVLAIIFLAAGMTPVPSLGMVTGTTPLSDVAVRFSGWGDVLAAIGRIFPDVSAILDFIRLVVSVVSQCAPHL